MPIYFKGNLRGHSISHYFRLPSFPDIMDSRVVLERSRRTPARVRITVTVLDCTPQVRHDNFCDRHSEDDLWQQEGRTQFPTAYKLKAIKRAEGGEGVLPVARELGISRKLLHDWIKAWKAHGPEGLNRKPGRSLAPASSKLRQTDDDKRSALARAKPASPNSNGWSAANRWISIFFEKPCAPWSGRQRKANPLRIIEVIQAMTSEAGFQRRRAASLQVRRAAARDLLPASQQTRRETADCELRDQIQRICSASVLWLPARDSDHPTLRHGRKCQESARLMREDNLIARRKAPFLKPPAERPRDFLIVPNLVRGLVPSAPDQIWVADITYIHLAKSLRLSRRHPRRLLAQGGGLGLREHARCLARHRGAGQGIAARKPQPGSLIHHSDRGVQYASIDYRQRLG